MREVIYWEVQKLSSRNQKTMEERFSSARICQPHQSQLIYLWVIRIRKLYLSIKSSVEYKESISIRGLK